jgi:DNA-directed RNA polymerase subunit RPC12/RpoP
MIMHDYKCTKCLKLFTIGIPSNQSDDVKCPYCKKPLKKVWLKGPMVRVR